MYKIEEVKSEGYIISLSVYLCSSTCASVHFSPYHIDKVILEHSNVINTL